MRRKLLLAAALFSACEGPTATHNPMPTLVRVAPETVFVASTPAAITVTGTGFVEGSAAHLNGAQRASTVLSDSQLTFLPVGADLAAPDTLFLTVTSPTPGGGVSGLLPLPVLYAPVSVTSIDPDSAFTGELFSHVTVHGSGFLPSNVLQVNGSNVATTFISGNELRSTSVSALVTSGGVRSVRVRNITPNVTSNSVLFTTVNRAPTLTNLGPTSVLRSAAPLEITLYGANFYASSQVLVNGVSRAYDAITGASFRVTLDPADVVTPGAIQFRISNGAPGGGLSEIRTVNVVAPAPTLSSTSPATVVAGDTAFTLRLSGLDFPPAAAVFMNGTARPSTFVSSSALDVAISTADIATPGVLSFVVSDTARSLSSAALGLPVLADSLTLGPPTIVALDNHTIIVDPVRPVIYAAVPHTGAQHANSIVKIDAATGAVSSPLFIGGNPYELAISDDGAYLYVAQYAQSNIVRVRLSDYTVDLTIPLPAATRAEDMVVLDGHPTSVAVSLEKMGSNPRFGGVYVYDNATARPVFYYAHLGTNRITRGRNANELLGFDAESSDRGLRRLIIAADGVRAGAVNLFSYLGSDIVLAAGRVWGNSGSVHDAETLGFVDAVPVSGAYAVDPQSGRAHYNVDGHLQTFSLTSFELLGSKHIAALDGRTRVRRVGSNGLAFGGGTHVVLVSGTLIGH